MELKAKVTKQGGLFTSDPSKIVKRNLDSTMFSSVMLLERGIKERTPTGVMGTSGGLVSGIHGEVIGKGTLAVKGIVSSHPSHVHAETIDKGRTPGKAMPPAGTLVRWIEMKFGMTETEAQRIEFVVRRKIGKKGSKGAQMFDNTLDFYWPQIKEGFEECGYKIARDLGGK